MRKTFLFFILILLCVAIVEADTGAPSGWNVYGRLTVGGVAEDHVLMSFACGSEKIVRDTANGGEFSFDVSEFNTCSMFSDLTLVYCYKTWQCAEIKDVFSYTGGGNGAQKDRDLPGMTASYPLFIIIGKVTNNGIPISGGEYVKIENLRTGIYAMWGVDSEGQYSVNLADFKYGWWDKDWIQVCHDQKCNVVQALESLPGLTVDLELTDETLTPPESPYYHGERHKYHYYPAPEEPEEPTEPTEPVPPVEPTEPVVEPTEPITPPITPEPGKAWLWILIIVIIVVIGVGYWFMKKK